MFKKEILKSKQKNNKICPECGSDKFYIPQTNGVYEKPLYIFHRTIKNNSYVESSYINKAKCCVKCGLFVTGIDDIRTEINWTEMDIINYFIEKIYKENKNYDRKLEKQLINLIHNMPKSEKIYIIQLKFSHVCKIFEELLINGDYTKILSIKI